MIIHLYPKVVFLKTLFFLLLFLRASFIVSAQAPFITVWQTDNTYAGPKHSEDNQITIPGIGNNYNIEWEEVGNEANNNGSEVGTDVHTITFPTIGTYRVKISGDFSSIRFGYEGDMFKIRDIQQWGDIQWSTMERAFNGCGNLACTAIDVPDLSRVTTMNRMFSNATSFNGDIGNWDVSNVTEMQYLFYRAFSFNADISSWNVSNVTDMSGMFAQTRLFNGAIGNWDTSNVIDMGQMFAGASSFNQAIGSWDVSNVTDMSSMFSGVKSFNRSIGNWDVSGVNNMEYMFGATASFNQDLGQWDVSNVTVMTGMFAGSNFVHVGIAEWDVSSVTNMDRMFFNAGFNGIIGAWDISNVTDMTNMLSFSNINTYNYDQTLIGWAGLANTPQNITLGAISLNYCVSSEAHDFLVNDKNWTIEGDNENCDNGYFISTWKTDNEGTSNDNQITIPVTGTDYLINWEEVDNESNNNGTVTATDTHTITFPTIGIYRIKISGNFNRINFNNEGDKLKIVDLVSWGDMAWSSLAGAFHGCSNLYPEAHGTPDLSNVSDMSYMFSGTAINRGAGAISDIIVSHWDVSNVTNMSHMFAEAKYGFLGISNWDVSNVTDMSYMFLGINEFNENINNWNVSNVSNMEGMFSHTNRFNQDLSSWNLSKVTNMNYMFSYARIFSQDISQWDVSQVTTMKGMFEGHSDFNGDLSNWNVSNVTDMSAMFAFAEKFNTNIGNWKVSEVTNMSSMFSHTDSFNIDISNWDVSNVTDMANMFNAAASFNQDLSNWDVLNVTNMYAMFSGAEAFNAEIGDWNVSNVTNMGSMFQEADSFSGDLSKWDVSNVTDMRYMFFGLPSFNSDLSNWDVSNVTNMQSMFAGATSFNSDISNWNVSKVNNMARMLRNCSLFNADLSNWDVTNVTDMSYMLSNVSSFNSDLSNWDVSTVTDISGMFYEANSFDQNLGGWNLSNVNSLFGFLTNSGLSIKNYDLSLEGWATSGHLPSYVVLSAESLYYCASAAYRQLIIDKYRWWIVGDEPCSIALQATFPAVGATGVEKDTEIHLTFDKKIEEIDFGQITLKDINGREIEILDVFIDSLSLYIVSAELGFNTYEVHLPKETIISAAGKEIEAISWSFTTQSILSSEEKQIATEQITYPNPFSDFTYVRFHLAQTQPVSLMVFDLKGQLVRQEQYGMLEAGEQSVRFERDDLPAGLYHYQLQTAIGNVGGKMLVK